MDNKIGKKNAVTRWILIALYVVSVIAFAGNPAGGTGIIALTGCIFIFLHAPKRYGWKTTLIFIACAFIVSTLLEDLSIHTGFPFGKYHYTFPGSRIDQVPIVVGPMYIAVGYFSWSIGCLILNHADRHLDKKINLFALPAISAFIMVQFDLVQDPSTSTFQGLWVWENGGGFFGVPLSNFLGWYLTCYIFMQIFTLFLAKKQFKLPSPPELQKKSFWLQPVIMYLLIALSYVSQYIYQFHNTTEMIDKAGNLWTVNNMYESAVTIMLFSMLFSVVLSVYHLFTDDRCTIATDSSSK